MGDDLAVVEDEDLLADLHHDLHLVVGDNDRLAVANPAVHLLEQPSFHGRIDAGERLIKHHECRVGHQQADELQELLLAVGEVGAVFVPNVAQRDDIEQFLARDRAAAGPRGDDDQILERRHPPEEPGQLERAADAELVDFVRPKAVMSSHETNGSGIGAGDASHHVEEGRFARAVRSDYAGDSVRPDRQGRLVERLHAAEADRDIVDGEDWGRPVRPLISGGGLLEWLGSSRITGWRSGHGATHSLRLRGNQSQR